MRREVTFSIPGPPRPLHRHKATAVRRFVKGQWKWTVKTYDDERNGPNKRAIAALFLQAAGGGFEPIAGPVELRITIESAPARSWPKWKKLFTLYDTRKPDWDNVAKLVCDALNGIAWNDDAQVVRVYLEKCVAVPLTSGKTVVTVRALVTPQERRRRTSRSRAGRNRRSRHEDDGDR